MVDGYVISVRNPTYVIGIVFMAVGELCWTPASDWITDIGLRGYQHSEK